MQNADDFSSPDYVANLQCIIKLCFSVVVDQHGKLALVKLHISWMCWFAWKSIAKNTHCITIIIIITISSGSSIAIINTHIQGVHMCAFTYIPMEKKKAAHINYRHIKPFPMRLFKKLCCLNRWVPCWFYCCFCCLNMLWLCKKKKTFEAI